MSQPEAQLLELLQRVGPPAAAEWLDETLASLDLNSERAVRIAVARCARKVGPGPLEPLDATGLPPAVSAQWCLQDVARAVLVLRFFAARGDEAAKPFDGWARRGEQGEQASFFRMLSLLPGPERFVELAVEGCRTNSEVVFGAIALQNAFPAAHFPELNFNQLVLKTIFMGLPVPEIEGLAGRVNEDLVGMARDYASERNAAGRSVPTDIASLERLWESR
ncbi:MAG: EboA domain-containing protein [Myxococcota bacterium]